MRGLGKEYWEDYNNNNLTAAYISMIKFVSPDLTLTEEQLEKYISVKNNFFACVSNSSSFIFGDLITDTFQLELINEDMYWDYVNITKSTTIEISVECKRDNDETKVYAIGFGKFKIIEISKVGDYITLSLTKAITSGAPPVWSRFNPNKATQTTMVPFLPYGKFIETIANLTKLTIDNKIFVPEEYQNISCVDADNMPSFSTVADLLKAIAAYGGGYARICDYNKVSFHPIAYVDGNGSNNNLYLLKYLNDYLYNGGIFDEVKEEYYLSGDCLDGGDFTDYDEKGEFNDRLLELEDVAYQNSHFIHDSQISNLTKEEKVVISGLKGKFYTFEYVGSPTEEAVQLQRNDNEFQYNERGNENAMLELQSGLIMASYAPKQNTWSEQLAHELSQIEYVPISLDIITNFDIDVGDILCIDEPTGAFFTFVGGVTQNINGFTSITCNNIN